MINMRYIFEWNLSRKQYLEYHSGNKCIDTFLSVEFGNAYFLFFYQQFVI